MPRAGQGLGTEIGTEGMGVWAGVPRRVEAHQSLTSNKGAARRPYARRHRATKPSEGLGRTRQRRSSFPLPPLPGLVIIVHAFALADGIEGFGCSRGYTIAAAIITTR